MASAAVIGNVIRYTPNSDSATTLVAADSLVYRVADSEGAVSAPISVQIYRVTQAMAWQNPANRLDVNGDLAISPLDALLVINNIGVALDYPASAPSLAGGPEPFVDVDGDGSVSPIDALLIINDLNQPSSVPPALALSSGYCFRAIC